MTATFDPTNVPAVDTSDLEFVMQHLIASGQGLALLKGLSEDEIRGLEDRIWAEFDGPCHARLAVALRFRALLQVFASRRLKALFMERGYRLLAAIAREAAARPLNTRFGFNTQRLLLALDGATSTAPVPVRETAPIPLAA